MSRHDELIRLRHMRDHAAEANSRLPNPQVKTLLQRQIDALVYELYGLTAEEIAIVEGNSQT